MKALIAIVALLVLVGCTMPGPLIDPSIGQSIHQSTGSGDGCLARILASREYQALKAKLPPAEPDTLPSAAQQADPSKATAEEAAMVRSFHDKYVTSCRQEGLRHPAFRDPAVRKTMMDSFARTDASYRAPIDGRITWGQYNKEVHALRTETRAKLLAIAR